MSQNELLQFLFFIVSAAFLLYSDLFVCFCCALKHMSGRERERQETVQMAVLSAAPAKPRRDSMGTVFSSRACRFFQIAYLAL